MVVQTFICRLLFVNVVFPNGNKYHKKEKAVNVDTITIVGKDTIALNGVSKKTVEMKTKPELIKEEPVKLNSAEQLFEHMHNKFVHFPIALGLFAFFLSMLNFKWKNYDTVILISVLVSLLSSIVEFITGKNQVEPIAGTGKEWTVNFNFNSYCRFLRRCNCSLMEFLFI